ncbi:MAG: thymidylate synthase, partial [Candidatus Thorarchaeota archaeon]
MEIISARNVEEALILGMRKIAQEGKERPSRNGPVLVFDGPVTTVFRKPQERVMLLPERDANPFFHFMEGLWMLAGRNDVEWISQFNSTIENYSDNGVTFHGAYGHRWCNYFNSGGGVLDQLLTV